MLNPSSIRTISDLRTDPHAVIKSAQELNEPVYIFYRSTPQVAVINIDDFNRLIEEVEDLKDALEVAKRQNDRKRKLIPWTKIKKELNL